MIKKFPMEGVEVWKNPKNKFLIFQLHFSANETKRDPAYMDTMKAAMPIRQFMQEYMLQWESYAGTPVYPDFQRKIHGVENSIDPVLGLPLVRGWDFGLTPACVVAQYVENQLRVICEFTALNEGADTFVTRTLQKLNVKYPLFRGSDNWIDSIDPSGFARKDTDMSTCAQIMIKKGLTPIPGAVTWEDRRTGVESFLIRYTKQGPGFIISLSECPTLVRGFEGGYRYDEKVIDLEPAKIRPLKDEHSHAHDALQYICGIVRQRMRLKRVNVPTPSYSRAESNSRTITKEGS